MITEQIKKTDTIMSPTSKIEGASQFDCSRKNTDSDPGLKLLLGLSSRVSRIFGSGTINRNGKRAVI